MRKIFTIGVVALCAIGLLATGAMAQVSEFSNVASTSKRGSMLIFPKVDTQVVFNPANNSPIFQRDTIITIGNTGQRTVTVECVWKYPNVQQVLKTDPTAPNVAGNGTGRQYRVWEQNCCGDQNFTFDITSGDVVYFSAGTGFANLLSNGFTFDGFGIQPAEANGLGGLTCFVVDNNINKQPISYNRLYGDATIINVPIFNADGFDEAILFNTGPTAWKYTAWAFESRVQVGLPSAKSLGNGQYNLELLGKLGSYNACPEELTFNFVPKIAFADQRAPKSIGTPILGTSLTLMSCEQDLRHDAVDKKEPSTLAIFKVYNPNENAFSAPGACVKCWFESVLGATDVGRSYQQAAANEGTPFSFATDLNQDQNFGYRLPRVKDAFQLAGGVGSRFNSIFPSLFGVVGLYGRATVNTEAIASNISPSCAPGDPKINMVKVPLIGVAYDFLDVFGNPGAVENPTISQNIFAFEVPVTPDGIPEVTAGTNLVGYGLETATIKFDSRF